MAKPRSSSSKRSREFKKRERAQLKQDRTALKRLRRDNNEGAPTPLASDGARGTEGNTQQAVDHDAHLSFAEDRAPESDAGGESGKCAC